MNDILNLVVTHKDVLIAACGVVWEIVVRLKPTAKDWSIVNFIKRLNRYYSQQQSERGDTLKREGLLINSLLHFIECV
jgi:hypothetical protein